MKACGRAKNGRKCGTLFEGDGSYCKDCRNEYQREYYARRKAPLFKTVHDNLGVSCQACSTGLRSNTIEIVETKETDVTLCATCKAVVTYLSTTVDEAAQEFLMDLAMTIAAENYNTPAHTAHQPHVALLPYQPTILGPGSVEACIGCDAPARPGKATCEVHDDYEETYQNSEAAKAYRGELDAGE